MFGLSNNKQDNQDDQVMLKNVSQLATDLNSSSSTPQSTVTQTSQPDDSSARSGFPASSDPVQQDSQSTDAVQSDSAPVQPVTAEEPTDTAEQNTPVEPPSSFTFPDTPSQEQPSEQKHSTIEEPAPAEPLSTPSEPGASPAITGHSTPVANPDPAPANEVEDISDTATTEEPAMNTTPSEEVVASDSTESSEPEPSLPSATSVEPADVQDANQTPLSAPIDREKLDAMKQQAIEHLDPLVDHLEHSPEETFKTTMMMIQANDNHTLLDKAFEAAKLIADDKMRAQAMLDIINEINYFSQGTTDENPAS